MPRKFLIVDLNGYLECESFNTEEEVKKAFSELEAFTGDFDLVILKWDENLFAYRAVRSSVKL